MLLKEATGMRLLDLAAYTVKFRNEKNNYVPVGLKCCTNKDNFYMYEAHELLRELLISYGVKEGIIDVA